MQPFEHLSVPCIAGDLTLNSLEAFHFLQKHRLGFSQLLFTLDQVRSTDIFPAQLCTASEPVTCPPSRSTCRGVGRANLRTPISNVRGFDIESNSLPIVRLVDQVHLRRTIRYNGFRVGRLHSIVALLGDGHHLR